jgi:hypothetical protein
MFRILAGPILVVGIRSILHFRFLLGPRFLRPATTQRDGVLDYLVVVGPSSSGSRMTVGLKAV